MDHMSYLSLEEMKAVDVTLVNKNDLVDLNSVQIDDSKSVNDRVLSFLQQIQNPYCFRVGDVVVKLNYKADGPSFQQNFEDMLRSV